jgi:hypothetical protein
MNHFSKIKLCPDRGDSKVVFRINHNGGKMKKLSILLLIVVYLSACNSQVSDSQIQTAIVQTQLNQATETPLPTNTFVPSNTPTMTYTPTPVPTETPTTEPSPTPDLRVLDIDPYQLLLQKSDCNPDGRYFLPGEGWISPHKNSEVIASWTVEKGQEYLAETGRIDGWYVYYARGNNNVLLPQQVYDNVVLFSSIEGAQLLVTKYGNKRVTEEFFDEVKDPPLIGDLTRAFVKRETNSSGVTEIFYILTFSYRNITHSIGVVGYEKETKLEPEFLT